MRFGQRKTWSQHTLAVRQRAQSNVGSTVAASRDRLIGTLIGAAFGAIFSLLGESVWLYLAAVVAAMVACSLLGLKNSSRLAAVTVTILMLVHRTGSNWTLPLHRVLEVLLGIVVALAISALVLPSRASSRLRDGLAQQFLLLSALFTALIGCFRGQGTGNLSHIWQGTEAALEDNRLLLEAARNEPSSGPASLERLSLLHQAARELVDLLHALDLAAQCSANTVAGAELYAGSLEPELGRLVTAINEEFAQLAACIHAWNFDQTHTTSELDNGISALESKMTAIRPTGLEFPQAEILRAYAVQLHLKQLARVLKVASASAA